MRRWVCGRPCFWCLLRLTQGLAVGGEYGSAATYVAEHARPDHRGYYTSWLQTTSTIGLLLSLLVILACRLTLGDEAFKAWGWRIPFLTSILLLAVSVYIRLKLEESPVFQKMKLDGCTSKSPIRETFGSWGNIKGVLVLLFGITSGMTVIWYGAQFYALFFMQNTLQVDYKTSYAIIADRLGPGYSSHRSGRRAVRSHRAQTGHDCRDAVGRGDVFSELPRARQFRQSGIGGLLRTKPDPDQRRQLHFLLVRGADICMRQGAQILQPQRAFVHLDSCGRRRRRGDPHRGTTLIGFDESAYKKALETAGFKGAAANVNIVGSIAVMVWLLALVGMVYGPMAAFMVEMFPAKIRTTSLSLPYHLGVGILGGFLPFVASALVIYAGNIYAGLWYPVGLALATAIIALFVLPETKDRAID